MKKLHLHKIFHWLYAFLMFLPFILFFCEIITHWGSPYVVDGEMWSSLEVFNWVVDPLINDYGFEPLSSVFNWLNDFFGTGWGPVPLLLEYWIITSVYYLVFDVIMFIINVAHHWLDAGGDKL